MSEVAMYRGVPLEDMTKEELIQAVRDLGALNKNQFEQHRQNLDTLRQFNGRVYGG